MNYESDINDNDLELLINYECNNDCEEWRPVIDYEGYYEVSNLGRVRSINRIRKSGAMKEGVVLKQCLNNRYYIVNLVKEGISHVFRVHRLVAQVFVPNPENKPNVDHINTDTKDNRACNLRWVTQKENFSNELSLKKWNDSVKKRKRVYSTSKKIVCLNTREIFNTISEAADKYNTGTDFDNLSRGIGLCCKGKYSYSGTVINTGEKLVWAYYEDYINMSEEDIINKLIINENKGRSKKVYCITTGKVFNNSKEAAEYYKIKCPSTIRDVCHNRKKSTYNGLNPNQRLKWKFIDE